MLSIIIGLLLRFEGAFNLLGINFKHFLHGHSHVALLGWGFNAIFLGVCHSLNTLSNRQKRTLNIIFWLAQVTIIGMMFSFPIQGYKLISITFSTLFLFVSYWFGVFYWRTSTRDTSFGAKFLKWAMLYLIISSIGPWSLGIINATGLRDTIWFNLSIYFYLHYLYNGFILFAIFGLVFKYLDTNLSRYNVASAKKFFLLQNISIHLTLALSALWVDGGTWINLIGLLGAIIQLASLYYLIFTIKSLSTCTKPKIEKSTQLLLLIAIVTLSIKFFMQLLSGYPLVADWLISTKPFIVIAYIHLVMLGILTVFFLGYFIQIKWLHLETTVSKIGIGLFLGGFLASETLLFGQGGLAILEYGMIPNYHSLLFTISASMPIGLIILYAAQWIFNKEQSN